MCEIDSDEAEVTIVEGTMSYTDEYGDKVTEDAAEADMDAFGLVKIGGKWYLSEDTLIEMGFDFIAASMTPAAEALMTAETPPD